MIKGNNFLGWNEHRKSIKNLGIVFSFRAIQKVASLITVILIARALTQEQYGYYNYIYTYIGLLSFFTLPGFKEGIKQSASRGFYGTFLIVNGMALKSSLIASCILLSLAGWYWAEGNETLFHGFLLSGLLFPLFEGIGQWRPFFAGCEKFSALFVTNIISSISRLIFIFVVLTYYEPNIMLVLGVNILIYGGENIIMSLLARRMVKQSPEIEPGILDYSSKINIYKLLDTISKQLDKLLIFYFLSPEALAVYAISIQFADLVRKPTFDIALVLTPKMARKETYTKSLDKKLFYLGLGTSFFVVIFVFIAPYLLPLLYSVKYGEAVLIAQLVMTAQVLGNITFFQSQFFKSKMDAKSMKKLMLMSASLRIFGNVIFIPFIGIYGAIISLCVERVCRAIAIRRIIKSKYLLD